MLPEKRPATNWFCEDDKELIQSSSYSSFSNYGYFIFRE